MDRAYSTRQGAAARRRYRGGSSDAAAVVAHGRRTGVQTCSERPARVPGRGCPRLHGGAGVSDAGDRRGKSRPLSCRYCMRLLVNPGVEVPTGFGLQGTMETRDNPAMPDTIPAFDGPEGCAEWLTDQQRNDLEYPAMRHAPQIGSKCWMNCATLGMCCWPACPGPGRPVLRFTRR